MNHAWYNMNDTESFKTNVNALLSSNVSYNLKEVKKCIVICFLKRDIYLQS